MSKTIIVEGPTFYAQGDEDAFFSWLKSIKVIKRVVGSGWNLEITFSGEQLSRADFKEVVALFERYRMDKQGLKQLIRPGSKWAQNKKLYWHADVFDANRPGRARRSRSV